MGILFCVMRAEAIGLTMQAVELVSRREGERLLDGFGILGADFLFFGNGKYWKVLILVMFATGMLGMVVMSGDREKDVRRVVSVMNEIGVGGLNLEVVMDNEASLQSLVNAALMKSNCRSFHPRHVAVACPQAKRLERFVGICREGVFANGLALQEHLKVRLALEAPVLGYLIGHVYTELTMLFNLEKRDTFRTSSRSTRISD